MTVQLNTRVLRIAGQFFISPYSCYLLLHLKSELPSITMWVLKRLNINSDNGNRRRNQPKKVSLTIHSPPIHFGSDADSDVRCQSDYVSGKHCVFSFRETRITFAPQIFDKNSTHGTFVNGSKIRPLRYHPLKDGDIISLGMDLDMARQVKPNYVYQLHRLGPNNLAKLRQLVDFGRYKGPFPNSDGKGCSGLHLVK